MVRFTEPGQFQLGEIGRPVDPGRGTVPLPLATDCLAAGAHHQRPNYPNAKPVSRKTREHVNYATVASFDLGDRQKEIYQSNSEP